MRGSRSSAHCACTARRVEKVVLYAVESERRKAEFVRAASIPLKIGSDVTCFALQCVERRLPYATLLQSPGRVNSVDSRNCVARVQQLSARSSWGVNHPGSNSTSTGILRRCRQPVGGRGARSAKRQSEQVLCNELHHAVSLILALLESINFDPPRESRLDPSIPLECASSPSRNWTPCVRVLRALLPSAP